MIYEGKEIIPLQFLKAVLPEPASLGSTTKGKTNIGDIATGFKDGDERTFYIYQICDHEEAFAETGNQAVSYTTGVPAICIMAKAKPIRTPSTRAITHSHRVAPSPSKMRGLNR